MRIGVLSLSVALLLSSWGATAAIPKTAAQRKIAEISAREPLRSSIFGLMAVTADGDTIASFNAGRKMIPASNVKLLTTGLALKQLGPDFRFETKIGYTGDVIDSTLTGDLYIIGGADPTIGSKSACALPLTSLFESWLRIIKDAGIARIDGRIVGDPRFFVNPTPENLGWSYDDLGTNYGVAPIGLNFYENAQTFFITPGPTVGSRIFVSPRYPDTPWMKYTISAKTGKSATANSVFYVNTAFGPYGEIGGSFPIDRKGYTLESANRFGAYTCARYFNTYLKAAGMVSEGGFADISNDGFIRTSLSAGLSFMKAAEADSIRIIGSTYSSKLSQIVAATNKDSDNFFAETLFKMIGRQGDGTVGYELSAGTAADALKSMGIIVAGSCQLSDGSGLSRKNYISPAFFVDYLLKMTGSDVYDSFFASIPIPGEKGTLVHKFPNAGADFRKRIHIKSGSMDGVLCYSGYILPSSDKGRMIAFSLLINNCTTTPRRVNPDIDGIIEALAAEN